MANIFRAYDVRGLYPSEINEPITEDIGRRAAHMFESGPFIIGRDGRYGSVSLQEAFLKGLQAEAQKIHKTFTVIDIDLCTSPMFYFLVNHHKASGGAMITASHNPKEYNGIKAVRAGAVIIPGTEIEAINI